MSRRSRVLLALAVTAVAAVFIASGAMAPTDSYGASILGNVGTTLLLFVPLILLQRVFERRVTKVAKEATDEAIGEIPSQVGELKTTVDRLSELSASTDERLMRRIDTDMANAVDPARRIVEDPSFRTVYDAMAHGVETSAIAGDLYVPLPEQGLSLCFGYAEGRDALEVEAIPVGDRRGGATCTWSDGDSVEDLFEKIYIALRPKLGDRTPKLDPKEVFATLSKTIERAETRRHNAGEKPLWPVIEMPTDNWFITKYTVEHAREDGRPFELTDVYDKRVRQSPPTNRPDAGELPAVLAEANRRFTGR